MKYNKSYFSVLWLINFVSLGLFLFFSNYSEEHYIDVCQVTCSGNVHLQFSVTWLLKLSIQIGRILFQKLETIAFKVQILLRYPISTYIPLPVFIITFVFTVFPQIIRKFSLYWESFALYTPVRLLDEMIYNKTILETCFPFFVTFLLFLHPFTNCYFLYFCSVFAFSFPFITRDDEWGSTWGISSFIRTWFDTAHDCKALENLTLLNFEFQYLNIRSIQVTLAAQMSLLPIRFYACNGVILLETAAYINDVTLIVTGDGWKQRQSGYNYQRLIIFVWQDEFYIFSPDKWNLRDCNMEQYLTMDRP